ncbi:MAG: PAS domain-containing protein [Aquincola sp.]|nr:PAS domain-containing protein [Aquincola sp.]
MSDKHLSTQFDADLSGISARVLEMGGLVEAQVAQAVSALTHFDSDLAAAVLQNEERVNQMEVAIDRDLSAIIARRQPTARDLRLLIAVSKAIANLERVGDEAARIARTAQRLIRIGVWKYYPEADRLIWSPDIHDMYGVAEADFSGNFEAYTALVHPDDRAEMEKTYAAFVASGTPVFEFAHRILRPDGRIIHIQGVGELTQTPEGPLITGVVQDLTHQIERDNRIHLLDQSIGRLNDVVLIFEAAEGKAGADAPIVYVTPSFLRLTGLPSSEVIGQPIARVMTEAAITPGNKVRFYLKWDAKARRYVYEEAGFTVPEGEARQTRLCRSTTRCSTTTA